jgi:sugar lactone lactonase YvrE
MSQSPFEVVLDARTALGESPVWSVAQQRLFFVDINGRKLHKLDPHEVFDVEEDIGCIAPARDGGFVAGLRSGLWLLDERARKVRQLAANPENTARSRFNDGRVDPSGCYVAGTLDETKAASSGTLYHFDGRELVPLETGLLTSNGVAFSPDGRTLYHSDTPRFVVYSRDYDSATGKAGPKRVFVQLTPQGNDRGRPDGAAVDVEGCYWTALYEGGRLQRYSAQGRLLAEYPIPARRPTMPAFGGADLKTLYVTTAVDPNDHSGGQLFAMRVDTPGLPSQLYDPPADAGR